MDQKPDWKIAELYEKSWEIVKKNKVLWIFGMAVTAMSGGSSGNFNLPSGNSSSSTSTFPSPSPTPASRNPNTSLESSQDFDLQTLTQDFSSVLGDTTQTADVFSSGIGQLFSQVPTYFYALLGLEILAAIALGIVISVISSAWAHAGLINGVQLALGNKNVSIRESSERSFPSLKSLAWLLIVPGLVFAIIAVVVFGALGVAIAVAPSGPKAAAIGLLVIGAILALIALLLLAMTQIWAERKVILDGHSGPEALSHGWKMTREKFWPMLGIGIVNTILSAVIVMIPLMVLLAFVIGGAGAFAFNKALGIPLIGVGAILFLIFIFGLLLLSGILTAFKASVWTIAYNNIKNKYTKNG